MGERRQAAWDEAQRRYPTGDRQAGFVAGAAWADDNPPARLAGPHRWVHVIGPDGLRTVARYCAHCDSIKSNDETLEESND